MYCKKWGMKINTDKTKSLVINSTGRLIGSYIRSWERPGDLPRVIEFFVFSRVEGSETSEKTQ